MLDKLISDIIKQFLSGLDHTNSMSVSIAIKNFIKKSSNRLQQTKNVIFRTEPVDFYENYIPLTLRSEKESFRLIEIENLLNKYRSIGIIGSAGSGKTSLLKYLALQCLKNNFKIPILLDLRNYQIEKETFEDFVAGQINEELKFEIKKLFQSNKFLFLFDGFDEIDYLQGSNSINQLDSFINKYSGNNFVVTTRPGTNMESLSPLHIFQIEPLNNNDIYLFIEKLNIQSSLKKSIFESIEQHSELSEILKIPLFLSLYIVTFNSSNPNYITNKSIFLRNILDSLFSQHDSITKLGYIRDRVSNLNRDDLENIVSILAFRTLFSGRYELTKDQLFHEFEIIKTTTSIKFENEKLLFDLTITINILIAYDNHYFFPHIILLEYLATIFVSRLEFSSKTKFYERLFKSNKVFVSINIYEFLFELDYKHFSQLYLIPNLSKLAFEYRWKETFEIDNYQTEILLDFINQNVSSIKKGNIVSRNNLDKILQSLKLDVGEDYETDLLFDVL